jgi:hypothetical protein
MECPSREDNSTPRAMLARPKIKFVFISQGTTQIVGPLEIDETSYTNLLKDFKDFLDDGKPKSAKYTAGAIGDQHDFVVAFQNLAFIGVV